MDKKKKFFIYMNLKLVLLYFIVVLGLFNFMMLLIQINNIVFCIVTVLFLWMLDCTGHSNVSMSNDVFQK